MGASLFFAVAYDTALIADDVSNNFIKIYPNPSRGKFFIKLNDSVSKKATIKIISLLGKEVFHSKLTKDTQELNLQQLNKGIYICLISDDTFSITRKLIIN